MQIQLTRDITYNLGVNKSKKKKRNKDLILLNIFIIIVTICDELRSLSSSLQLKICKGSSFLRRIFIGL